MAADLVGTLEVITTKTFLVPNGESVWSEVNAGGWVVRVHILFENNAPAHGIRVVAMPDHAEIFLDKWDNALGTATIVPVQLGKRSDDRILLFMASNYVIGTANKLDLQFYLGGVQ